ncbi:MAG: antibiotic biosynthesis monooxygenase [Nitrospirae bacterium]|nr:antibiotic biosynthesis monooxygenase [Nitrospirota bacterium]
MIYILVNFHVQPSKVHEFELLHSALAQFMSGQPGCIAVKVHRSLKNPQEYVVYGTWENKEAWERAHQTVEFKTQFQKLPIEQHTLSSASFFEEAYSYKRSVVGMCCSK